MKLTTLSLSLISALSMAAVSAHAFTYTNDFSDASTINDFTFVGTDSSDWSIIGGELVDGFNNPVFQNYVGTPGFALINAAAGLSKFTLEVDVKVVSSQNGADYGHAGVVWGFQNLNLFNTSYIRTHWNQFTIWDRPYTGEVQTSIAGGATNGVFYHMTVDVDHDSKYLSVSVDGNTRVLSGAWYDAYAGSAPGQIGLVTWGENVAYDNLRITSASRVPDSSLGFAGYLALLASFIGFKRLVARKK